MSVGAVNKQTGDRIPTAGMPAVDSILSGTSTNPVQNKVVKEALDAKQDTLTFDDTPTDGSNNPVKSNGIYDSEKDIYAAMGEMGAKNLIPYPYDRESGYSSQGATVTYDKNGVMTVNKVAGTGTAFFALLSTTLNPNIKIVLKPNTRYILSLKLTNATNTSVAITKSTTGDIAGIRNKGTGYYETVFTTPADMSVLTGIILYWESNVTETNAIVEVMIRQANITDNTYQPYAKTNKQLTDDVALLESEKADTDIVASDFDATESYTAGNYCIYEGKFYKFKNNHSGAWSAADVDEIKIAGELSALKSGLTSVNDEIIVYHKRYNGGDLWDGDTLTFNNIKESSNIVYHFMAFNTGASGTPESAYLIVKATGVQVYDKVGTFTTAYDAEHETLTITLPTSTYWDYRFEVAARRNG